jgi:DNA-binding MarR family transcriptional regulator
MDGARVSVTGMDAPVVAEAARQLGELFPAVYLALHRRDAKRRALPGASRAVLQHLTLTGPVRIGELARHLSRAQSVVSEMVSHLERDGLLERRRDPRDARRTLVWLSGAGLDRLDEEHQVLSRELVERAMGRMPSRDVVALLRGLRAQVAAAAAQPSARDLKPERRTRS